MNIAIIDMDNLRSPFWAAGQARATREVGKRLVRSGHSVTVYTTRYPGCMDYEEDGIRYVHKGVGFTNSRLTNFAFVFSIPFIVRKIKADVIIENFNAPFSVSFAPLFTKIPVVVLPTMFNAMEFSRKYHFPFHWVERIGLKFYKYMLPYSEVDNAKANKLNPSIKMKIVPQGVSKEYFNVKRENPQFILYYGRLDIWQKGADLLLSSYAKVKDTIGYPLVMAGRGPDEEEIKRLVSHYNLEDKVKFVGYLSESQKMEVFSKSLYNAFPSRHDEICLGTLEVLAAGIPVVCFDLPESRWMTDDLALKAKPFDVNEYANLLVKATDESLNNRMKTRARTFARTYDWDSVAKQIEEFLEFAIKDSVTYNSNTSNVFI